MKVHYNIQILENEELTNRGESSYYWKINGTEHQSMRYFDTLKACALDVSKRFAVSIERGELK